MRREPPRPAGSETREDLRRTVISMPAEDRDTVLAAGGRARVTYDLQRGRIEMIEV